MKNYSVTMSLVNTNGITRQFVVVFLAIATLLSVSGIVYLAPTVATAQTIVDGDLVKTADNPDVYIVKLVGAKAFKRLILNPTIFDSYGHLSWGNIKTVTQATLNGYTNSNLVIEVNADGSVADPKVYAVTSADASDVGERRHLNVTAAQFESAGLDWDSIYKVNHTEASPSFYPTQTALTASDDLMTWATNVNGGGTTPAGGLSVSLAADTPAAQTVAKGAADVPFTKVSLSAGSSVTVNSITVTRSGLAADTDLTNVKLWDGSTQLGGIQALNTTTHKATFTGLNWTFSGSKALTITGTIASGTTGNAPRLGIAVASDIVPSDQNVSVSGSFPIVGNTMTLAGISVGVLNVDVRSIPADNSPVSGSVDQEIASWTFAATSTEGFDITQIVLTEVGSSVASDISNIKLKISGVQKGSTISSLNNDQAVFNLSGSPITVNASGSVVVYAYADIAAGVTTSRTVQFEITETNDVTAFGGNSGGSVVITASSGSTYSAQTGVAQTISQGTILTVSANGATNPSAQDFVVGTTDNLISAFKFSAGAGENQRVSRLKLELVGSGAGDVDLSNVRLYKYDSDTGVETQVGSSGSFSSNIATFGANSSGLDSGVFDISASSNVVIHVRADVPTGASWTTLEIVLEEVRVDGIQSQGDIGAAVITSLDELGEVVTHGASVAKGTLTMALSPSTPAAQNVVPGQTSHEFTRVDFTASGEAIILSSLIADLCEDAKCTDEAGNATAGADSGDFANVTLWRANGTQLGSAVASPSSTASFSFSLTIAKNTTETVYVTADVPTNATALWANVEGSIGIDRDVTAIGVSSGATITDPSADALGNIQLAVAETLAVAFQSVPYSTLVTNTSSAVISKVVLTAGNAGDVRVNSIKFTADDDAALSGTSAANSNFSTLQLYDGATQIGNTLATFTDGTPDTATFSALAVTVPKNGQKVLELKATVSGTTGSYFVGIADIDADVTSTGLASNTDITESGTGAGDSGEITLSAAGTLTVSVDPSTVTTGQVAVGTTAGATSVEWGSIKLEASDEDIELSRLQVALDTAVGGTTTDEVPGFAGVSLYLNGTKVSGPLAPTGTNAAADVTMNFGFTAGSVVVPKDGSLTLTIMADLNGVSTGATSGESPTFYVQNVAGSTDFSATDIDAKGKSSGVAVTSAAGTPNPETASNFNAQTIHKTTLSVALNSASPSGTATRSSNQTILSLDFDAASQSAALFRAASVNTAAALAGEFTDLDEGDWEEGTDAGTTDSAIAQSASSLNVLGANSVTWTKGTTGDADAFKFGFDAAVDISGYSGMAFWIQPNATSATDAVAVTLTGASPGSHTITVGGLVQADWQLVDIPFSAATTPFTGLTAVTDILFTETNELTDADDISIGGAYIYKDKIVVDMASNAGLYDPSADDHTGTVALKDGSTTLTTGYYSGTTSAGSVTFIPTTQFTIPTTGKTLTLVADTTTLITAVSKTLAMTMDLGSSSSTGVVTAGDVYWNDDSLSSTIKWVDSPSPVASGTLSY